MPMTTAFAPTAAALSEFYFDPASAAHADDDSRPAPVAAATPQPATQEAEPA